MRTRSHEGLKKEEAQAQTEHRLSGEQLCRKGPVGPAGDKTEMLAAKGPPAPWAIRLEGETGDPGKDPPLLSTH